MAVRKTNSASSHHHSLHMASSHPADTPRSVVLEVQVHTRIALAHRAAFLVALVRSLVDIPVHLACRLLHSELRLAGSHQAKVSISLRARSHHICRADQAALIRTSHRQGRGAHLRQDHRLAKMSHPRLLRRTVHPRHQRRTKVRRRQELHQLPLLYPSKLHHPRLSRNQMWLQHSRRLTHSLHRSEAERRVVKGVVESSLLYPYPAPGLRRPCPRLRRRRNPHNLR